LLPTDQGRDLALPDLAAHQWKHRVLIIDTPSVQDELSNR
jgi:hypothetical protein